MTQVILNIPEENIPLLLQITEALDIATSDILIKEGSPDWHSQIVHERLEKYNSGRTGTTTWQEFEKELDSED